MKLRKADLGLIAAVVVLFALGFAQSQRDHGDAAAGHGAAPAERAGGH